MSMETIKNNKENNPDTFFSGLPKSTVLKGVDLHCLLDKYIQPYDRFKYFELESVINTFCRGEFYFAVTKNESTITGIAELQINPYDETNLWIKHISVDPEFQNQGNSKTLLTEIFAFAKEKGLSLTVSTYSEQGEKFLKQTIDQLSQTEGVEVISPGS